ncbi:unnamed protein product [Spirodela intermedia]|uniref:Protein kinase domain-containing protein n=1 Tax=Spirodela intermedia TaxID=51605 RepID=A0A7I8IFN2_SPIIN|nr:unnamed protein product [Spirodela intermedia]CAA6655893.1 unnamed protein product [Spirodela intermedia]
MLIASENSLWGAIPDIFSGLPSLQILRLNGNEFDGGLPKSLCNGGSLNDLVLSENKLSGTIPEEIGRCRHLTILNLGANNLQGRSPLPAEMGNCTSLGDLELQFNSFEGPIPEEISGLEHLKTLLLFNNTLSGVLPRGIGKLSRLTDLHIYNNCNLERLSLAHNDLSGVLPSDLGKTTTSGLVEVDLTGNRLEGPIPSGLCTGNRLVVMGLGGNRFNGSFPQEIGGCSSLTRVILSNNRLQGRLSGNWSINGGISYMDLSGNLLGGHIPQVLGSWYNLSKLDLSDNQFSGPIPHELGNLKNLEVLDASGNQLTGVIPSELGDCGKLASLDLSRNLLSGAIPEKLITLTSLQRLLLQENCPLPSNLGNLHELSLGLNLSSNRLSGKLPASFGNLGKLEVLDLSNNSLSGEMPPELEKMISISSINLSYNHFSGKLPPDWVKFLASSPESFAGNDLCIQDDVTNSCPVPNRRGRTTKERTILTVIGCILLCLIGLSVALYLTFRGNDRWVRLKTPTQGSGSSKDLPEDLKIEDIMKITEDSSEKHVIGKGRHGTVYRLQSGIGKHWAVKKVDLSEGRPTTEMKILSSVKHRNLVRMVGYCIKDGFGLMVCEFMPGGTLSEVLHQKMPQVPLDWEARYLIALGIAEGLAYLHHDCIPAIIHRDIKSDNILMDSELNPKIGDFGMAKLLDGSDAGLTMSSIVGTLGYIAPENGYSTRITEKSDVYSYGVVLLELLCRKRPVDPTFEDGVDIETSPFFFLDEEISWWTEQEKLRALKLLDLAASCTQVPCEARPSMREVVKYLNQLNVQRKRTT